MIENRSYLNQGAMDEIVPAMLSGMKKMAAGYMIFILIAAFVVMGMDQSLAYMIMGADVIVFFVLFWGVNKRKKIIEKLLTEFFKDGLKSGSMYVHSQFREKDILCTHERETKTCMYREIDKIYESANYLVFAFCNGKGMLLLDKNKFEGGTYEALKEIMKPQLRFYYK